MRSASSANLSARLAAGFFVALLTLGLFAVVALRQISTLRTLQVEVIDRNRLNSLQLLRIQNTLNSLALAARDMAGEEEAYPIPAFRPQVDRLLLDLDDALRRESELAPSARLPGQSAQLQQSESQLRESFLLTFRLAEEGETLAARRQLSGAVYQHRSALSALVSRLLVQNYEAEEHSTEQAAEIHSQAERTILGFVALMAATVIGVAIYTVLHNRRVLAELERVSREKGDLAREMIGMQESILRTVSRELHDDFGQILTAVNTTLARVRKRSGELLDGSLSEQIAEVQEATRQALERARDLSQTLHPAVLESHGLVGALERFLPGFERQSGIRVYVEGSDSLAGIPATSAIHVYRLIQEALNNVARHAQTTVAWLRSTVDGDSLVLEIEDHGAGWNHTGTMQISHMNDGTQGGAGLGIVAMRERAQILGGEFALETPAEGGTRVRVKIPCPGEGLQ